MNPKYSFLSQMSLQKAVKVFLPFDNYIQKNAKNHI